MFILASCDSNVECIDADNFGNQLAVTIDAKGSPENLPNSNLQYVDWMNTGYVLNGKTVVMVVKNPVNQTVDGLKCGSNYTLSSTWVPWFGQSVTDASSTQPHGCIANFLNNSSHPWCDGLSSTSNVPVSNSPSYFYMGLGLYTSIGKTGNSPPSGKALICGEGIAYDASKPCLIHVGDNACINSDAGNLNSSNGNCHKLGTCDTGFVDQYCAAGGVAFTPPTECTDGICIPYMKILDRYYTDNAGGYTAVFKQGVRTNQLGVISKFVSTVMATLCGSSKSVYTSITKDGAYVSYIQALLILFIVVTALSFLMGFSEMSQSDLIIRVIKIGLISQLISPSSWEFFSQNFFSIFQNGVGELTGIMFGYGATAGSDPTSVVVGAGGTCIPNVAGFQAFDQVIDMIFSYEMTRKILSLLFWEFYGFIFIVTIYVLILVILYAVAKSILVFLVSYLAISILIILAPIFIPFILFQFTKPFFDNWIKQIITYFIQPLLILAFAFFLLTMMTNQLQSIFGYRVCWKELFEVPVLNIKFYYWQSDFNNTKACILTPNAILNDNAGKMEPVPFPGPGDQDCGSVSGLCNSGSCTETYADGTCAKYSESCNCDAYTCKQERYVGYPYLNPLLPGDQSRIDELKNGKLISFKDLAIFLITIWFMMKFGNMVPTIAKFVAGTQLGFTQIEDVAKGLRGGIARLPGAGISGANSVYKFATGRDMKYYSKFQATRKGLFGYRSSSSAYKEGGLKQKVQDTIGGGISKTYSKIEKYGAYGAITGAKKALSTTGKSTIGKAIVAGKYIKSKVSKISKIKR